MTKQTRWGTVAVVVVVVSAIGCKAKTQEPASRSATVGSAAGSTEELKDPPPTWTLETAPVDVDCGGAALDVRKPEATKPANDRTLEHDPGIAACRGLASLDAVCHCLATSVDRWGADTITAPARCKVTTPTDLTDATAAVVDVSTDPPDTATKAGGRAIVLLVQRGATWSAVGSVDIVADIDLTGTPKRSGMVRIDHVDVEPGLAGKLYLFQTRSWTSEHAVGETDADGTAQVTVCSVPRAPETPAFCYRPLVLGKWSYTHDDDSDKCTVPTADFFTAKISATSAMVHLVHGKDTQAEAGRYVF